ncbi:MAG TPA: dihydroorotase [Saprospiraceae bacterium]|nr:dihydroorotase [Saprospiraceae bacterium]
MSLLLKNITLIHPGSKYNRKKINLLIKDGKIAAIAMRIPKPKNTKVFDYEGACVSIGWIDVGTQVGDPGFEHREDIQSATRAAVFGGFTGIVCQANTNPTIHTKSEVLYLKNATSKSIVNFYPLGAVSQSCEGKDLTEMYDMHRAGAVAFSDGKKSIQDNGLMMRSLQYVKAFNGLIINHPHDDSLAYHGQLHEGIVSTSLGLKGIPSLAEDMMVQRDIYLAEYAESRLHIANISTVAAVKLVRKAKARGIKVTASVAAMNLIYTDKVLEEFDVNFKCLPPLREKKDVAALRRGIEDGTIDFISSNHTPIEEEVKDREFMYAKFGAIGLETSFALCNTYLSKKIGLEKLIELFAIRPREILGIEVPQIRKGAIANLTIFHPSEEWIFTKKHIQSKSSNTPFTGKKFKGKVLGIIANGQTAFVDEL